MLVGERRLDLDTDDWEWGARVDLLYGTDAWQTNARGLDAYPFNQFDNFGIPRWDSSRYYSLALPQLYGEVGRGDLSVLLGHFYTPLGYEVVPAVGNFFSTHSYAFMFGTPNTHTGVLARWEPTPLHSYALHFSTGRATPPRAALLDRRSQGVVAASDSSRSSPIRGQSGRS